MCPVVDEERWSVVVENSVTERGVLTAPDDAWEMAVRQAAVIGPVAVEATVGLEVADAAATELGISRRQVYVLIARWRAGEGVVSDLLRAVRVAGAAVAD
jgi:putative transposase